MTIFRNVPRLFLAGMFTLGFSACSNPPSKKSQSAKSSSVRDLSASTGSPSQGFLSSNDLQIPSNVRQDSQQDIIAQLNSSSFLFRAKIPTSDSADSDAGPDCYSRLFTALKGKMVGKALVFNGSIDFKECLAELSNAEAVYESMRSDFYSSLSCDNPDLAKLEGKTVKEISASKNPCEGISNSSQTQHKIQSRIKFISSAESSTVETLTIHAFGTSDLRACTETINGKSHSYDPKCQTVDIDIQTENGGIPEAIYRRLNYNNVKWTMQEQSTWYEAGTVEVALNNWQGKITFRGPDVAPSFTFKSGSLEAIGELTLEP